MPRGQQSTASGPQSRRGRGADEGITAPIRDAMNQMFDAMSNIARSGERQTGEPAGGRGRQSRTTSKAQPRQSSASSRRSAGGSSKTKSRSNSQGKSTGRKTGSRKRSR